VIRRGFTLLELLIVMALIFLLAALLFPLLAGAKAKAKAAFCLNNLKQWGVATHLYLADHEDWLPQDGHPNPLPSSTNVGWYIALPRQLGLPPYHEMPWRTNASVEPGPSLWICPSNKRRSNGRNLFHYCLNQHVNGTGDFNRPVQFYWIERPAMVVWLFDTKNLPAVGYWNFVHTNLHSQGAQLLFLDGHAERLHRREYWDPETNRGHRNNLKVIWNPWFSNHPL
jgi:prepilin-type N-terminal cleavage/methylation domain-containing protein/prepilin-type processing-associated H-X9-DG protein